SATTARNWPGSCRGRPRRGSVQSSLLTPSRARRPTARVVIHPRRQTQPAVHRLFPDRIARRRERRRVERADGDTADRRVAVAFPIQIAAAIGAEVEADAVAAIGAALVDLPLAF